MIGQQVASRIRQAFLEACQWIDWYNMLNEHTTDGCRMSVGCCFVHTIKRCRIRYSYPNEAKFIIVLVHRSPTYYQCFLQGTGEDVTSELFLILEAA